MAKWNYDYLRDVADHETKKTLESVQEIKSDYTGREGSKGKTKGGVMRHVMRIPFYALHGMFADTELKKLMNPEMDPHERKKALKKVAQMHPEWLVVDKL